MLMITLWCYTQNFYKKKKENLDSQIDGLHLPAQMQNKIMKKNGLFH